MYRSIPVANKACADRVRSQNDKLHRDRIQKMRPQVDTTEPSTVTMDHLRNNLKREQQLEDRYHAIDRENRILLQKMSEIMKPAGGTPRGRSAPHSLNRDSRKTTLNKITNENQAILRRIQQAQPVYNHVLWEDSYRKSYTYLKNTAEYPLVLKRQAPRPASLTPVGSASALKEDSPTSPSGDHGASKGSEDLKYVFKEGKKIGKDYFLVEMATDGRTLAISAYEGDGQRTLEYVMNEREHRKLYRELNGDYSRIADKLRIQGDKLIIDPRDGPMDLPRDHQMASTA
mmetsp:Transcript_7410/g.18707  ORF Transcript_7410/g.18707 Transcript_7410/m.18707 type:complete len:287 (-) Transcript_7410:52-912(-)|eukprot:CAMPEP_0183409712 /NCGR_PEP_ID=MMETSP0370-20130417/19040_1 /TAXON_ID=268820 /ORGANISM="Peridinium aciculiferum, Strain PAER-2" /LENGTH=286 /DNA_ID=CAMNT_0025592443 /DNA_START=32 /DNA_END=892 /DNA_ORIENTATION=+